MKNVPQILTPQLIASVDEFLSATRPCDDDRVVEVTLQLEVLEYRAQNGDVEARDFLTRPDIRKILE